MKPIYTWRPAKVELARPNRGLLHKLIKRSAELAGLPAQEDWIATVKFVADGPMAKANMEYVGHEGTTDVITFSYFDDPESLFAGDVAVELIICSDVARREGDERPDSSFAEELTLYISHGFLHASGEDDLSEEPRKQMRIREAEVMTALRQEFDLNEVFGVKGIS